MNRTIRAKTFDDMMQEAKNRFLDYEKHKATVQRKKEFALTHPLKDYCDWVIKIVSERYGYTVEDLKSARKSPKISEPRSIAVYIISENTDFKTHSANFVNKDRTSFYHMMETIEGLVMYNGNQKLFEELKSLCSLSSYNREGFVDNK